RQTGKWALILLLATLAMTPLQRLAHSLLPARLRRMLGLFAFAYACVHFGIYAYFDRGLSFAGLWDDIVFRPYILVGFAALVLLIPLALTSTDNMMRRLGRRWKPLHRLVYLCAGLAVLHFVWQVKPGNLDPWYYAVVLALLLALRLAWWRRRRG